MTVRIRIKRHCPPVMQSNGETADVSVGYVITVLPHVAAALIRQGLAEPEDDGVPPLSDYTPDFDGKASTTKKEPSYEFRLKASTPDGTEYQQDVEWQPPPSTAELIAVMKKDEGVR